MHRDLRCPPRPTASGRIAKAAAQLPAREAIIEGEAVSFDGNSIADFHALRRQLGQPRARIVFRAFDLLWLDGEDLRPLPWSERKRRLQALLAGLPATSAAVIAYVEALHEEGDAVPRNAWPRRPSRHCLQAASTRPFAPAAPTPGGKTKCERSDTFAVVGYSVDYRGRLDGLHLARAGRG